MAQASNGSDGDGLGESVRSAAAKIADQAREHPMTTAAIVGGAAAAGAGAWLGARALARRNAEGRQLNAAMAAAITASECAPAGQR